MTDFTPATPHAIALRDRTEALVSLFSRVAQTRMLGVPILNPALSVEALGFEPCKTIQGQTPELPGALGVLITPWFMNLFWFPLAHSDQSDGVGRSRLRRVGVESFNFIGGHEPGFGRYEACSLFSPMFEFADPAAARETALAVLAALRPPVVTPSLAARRAFLFGRRGSTRVTP